MSSSQWSLQIPEAAHFSSTENCTVMNNVTFHLAVRNTEFRQEQGVAAATSLRCPQKRYPAANRFLPLQCNPGTWSGVRCIHRHVFPPLEPLPRIMSGTLQESVVLSAINMTCLSRSSVRQALYCFWSRLAPVSLNAGRQKITSSIIRRHLQSPLLFGVTLATSHHRLRCIHRYRISYRQDLK